MLNTLGVIKNKNILFLQGPMGVFFKKLDILFTLEGAKTYKIGFNAGDWFFSRRKNYVAYRDKRENYSTFIENFLQKEKIDKIFLFGDCRFYQSISIVVAKKLGVDIFVFEEGYIRPNFITMEKYGVNNYSYISREARFYNEIKLHKNIQVKETYPSQMKMLLSAAIYYAVSNVLSYKYPNYIHHRNFSAIKELFYGVRSLIRKIIFPIYEKEYLSLIQGKLSKKYFFVPLQTYNDFQILEHSEYKSIEKFIIEVLDSFAKNTSKEYLIFKHHPVDRGRKNYKKFILKQAEFLNIKERILVFFDVHLPTCLKNSLGTITINSTVGLSSLYHKIPTITLGNAIYDIEGLTCKGISLDVFWKNRTLPNMKLLKKYRQFIIDNTQLNASFYGKLPEFSFEKNKYKKQG